jgi:site-specific DNA recombinase
MSDVVLYARHSTIKQQSCAMQLSALRQWAAAHDHRVVGEFADEAVSGRSTAGREQFQAAIKLATGERGRVFAVHSLSRFSRSISDAINYAKRLDKAGCQLVSHKEQIDTTTPAGRLFFHILAALGEFERELISERTRDSLRARAADGKRVSRHPPYGFKFVDGLLEPDTEEQLAVYRIRELRQGGLGYRRICRVMDNEGWPPRTQWTTKLIERVIRYHEIDADIKAAMQGGAAAAVS